MAKTEPSFEELLAMCDAEADVMAAKAKVNEDAPHDNPPDGKDEPPKEEQKEDPKAEPKEETKPEKSLKDEINGDTGKEASEEEAPEEEKKEETHEEAKEAPEKEANEEPPKEKKKRGRSKKAKEPVQETDETVAKTDKKEKDCQRNKKYPTCPVEERTSPVSDHQEQVIHNAVQRVLNDVMHRVKYGMKSVHRVYKKKGGEIIRDEYSNEMIDVPEIEGPKATVGVTGGRTITDGNYGSYKMDVFVCVPCNLGEEEQAYDYAANVVGKKLAEFVKETGGK